MMFGGAWFSDVLAALPPPDPQPSDTHYSNLWEYTVRGKPRRISCFHLHPTEAHAQQCARTIVAQMGRLRKENKVVDTQHIASVLARANNVKYVGITVEEL